MNKYMLNNELSEEQGKPYGIVYKATNKHNGKSYIGITTTSLKIRRSGHMRNAKNANEATPYFLRAIQKYGMESFVWEEIDIACNIEQLYGLEVKWIKEYGTYGDKGYNMTRGGEGILGLVRSPEFAKDKSELVHRLRKEGKMGKNPAIDYKDAKDVRDLILKNIKIECIASLYGVNLSSVKSLKNGVAKSYLTSNTLNEQDIDDMSKIKYYLLNRDDVLSIKNLILQGETLISIANKYNVNSSTISLLKRGKSYRNIITDEDVKTMNDAMPIKPKRILTEDELLIIKKMLLNKKPCKDIASHIGCRPPLIHNIKNGKRHAHLFTPEELEQIKYKPKSHKINKDT